MIDFWFPEFIERLAQRIPGYSWPPMDEEYWRVVAQALVISGADEAVADEASMRVAQNPPTYLGDFLAELKKQIGIIFRERERAGKGAAPDSRVAAEEESRGCVDCHGEGLTSRYRHNPEAKPATLTCYCICQMGRWMEKNHREKSPEIHRRILDLASPKFRFLQLGPVAWTTDLDSPFRYPPSSWDSQALRPKPFADYRDDLARRLVAESSSVKPIASRKTYLTPHAIQSQETPNVQDSNARQTQAVQEAIY